MDEHQQPGADATRSVSGRWHVVAGPFTRAERLRAFLTLVGAIDGVTGLVAERFQQGEVALRLRYAGGPPLADCLAALVGFAPRVEMAGSGMLRLVLEYKSPDDAP